MTEKNFILATAGHVDHGKSSLVKALTGIDPDRLPEEKARGITIDLGFAHLRIKHENQVFRVGIIDVPGHEDFVKNMVAGVGAVDLALLVVAADDGWMPQTEEHLQILLYLNVRHLVVALTKIDTTSGLVTEMLTSIRKELANSGFDSAPIVPVSIHSPESIDALRVALGSELSRTDSPQNYGKPRLSVDRVFSLKGAGTIVSGTLIGGTLEAGQVIITQPRGFKARIRTIQTHNQTVQTAAPATRVALNLTDLSSDPSAPRSIWRGDVVTLPGYAKPTDTLDVSLDILSGAGGRKILSIDHGSLGRIHLGSASVLARVVLASKAALRAGEKGFAQLRLLSPVTAVRGDRFVIRDESGRATLAGGIVLDPAAERRRFHVPARQQFLSREIAALDSAEKAIGNRLAFTRIVSKENLLVDSRFSADEVSEALGRLVCSGEVRVINGLVLDRPEFDRLFKAATELIDAEHHTHPEKRFIGKV